ncbi:unnamed protein product, partial [Ectocarpus sp. 6 AP-2014]
SLGGSFGNLRSGPTINAKQDRHSRVGDPLETACAGGWTRGRAALGRRGRRLWWRRRPRWRRARARRTHGPRRPGPGRWSPRKRLPGSGAPPCRSKPSLVPLRTLVACMRVCYLLMYILASTV